MLGTPPLASAAPREARRPLRRALWLGGGLVALWLAMQFIPTLTPPAPAVAPVATADTPDTGTVAGRDVTFREERSVFSPGYLVAIALLAGGGVWALRLRRRTASEVLSTSTLQSLGTLTLAPGQTLHLVACGGDVLLVGQSATGVTLLATYPRETFVARARVTPLAAHPGAPAPPETVAPSFADLLRARAPHLFAVQDGQAA